MRIEKIENKKPIITKVGANLILLKLYISGLNSDGSFDFRKITLQEICFVGTYCYTKQDFLRTIDILKLNKIGNLNWIEYMDLKNGSQAFKKIHDGTCASPKIILIP